MKNYLKNLYGGTELKIPSFWASDNHCIDCYPESCDKNKKIEWSHFNGRNTFKGLKFSLNSSYTKIKSSKPIISNQNNLIGSIEVNENKIMASNRINIIIGPRSSGKSLLLEHILNLVDNVDYNKMYKNFTKNMKKNITSYDKGKMLSQPQKRVAYFKQSNFIEDAINSQTVLLSGLPASKKFENLDKILKPTFNFCLTLDNYVFNIQKILFRNISPFENINFFLKTNSDDWRFNFQDNIYECLDINKEIELINYYNIFLEERKKELEMIKTKISSFNENIKQPINNFYEKSRLENLQSLDFKLDILEFNLREIYNIQITLEKFCKRLQIIQNIQNILKSNLNKLKTDGQREKTNFNMKHRDICSDFFSLGLAIKTLKNFSDIKFESDYIDIDKSHAKANYMIQYNTFHSLRKENIIESLQEIIYKKFLEDTKDKSLNSNTISITKTISILGKCLLNNPNEETIFKNSFNKKIMNYETFRDKVYDSKVMPNITQNGIAIMENSPGLRAQILFELNLDREQIKDYSIILLDQPEDSIDNTYVSDDMIRIIKDLSNEKQIFLVTHNANLVVNLEPDNIIIPFNQNGEIKYYQGRLEDKILINKNEWNTIDLIAKYIEGGKHSLIKRIENYELGEIKNVN